MWVIYEIYRFLQNNSWVLKILLFVLTFIVASLFFAWLNLSELNSYKVYEKGKIGYIDPFGYINNDHAQGFDQLRKKRDSLFASTTIEKDSFNFTLEIKIKRDVCYFTTTYLHSETRGYSSKLDSNELYNAFYNHYKSLYTSYENAQNEFPLNLTKLGKSSSNRMGDLAGDYFKFWLIYNDLDSAFYNRMFVIYDQIDSFPNGYREKYEKIFDDFHYTSHKTQTWQQIHDTLKSIPKTGNSYAYSLPNSEIKFIEINSLCRFEDKPINAKLINKNTDLSLKVNFQNILNFFKNCYESILIRTLAMFFGFPVLINFLIKFKKQQTLNIPRNNMKDLEYNDATDFNKSNKKTMKILLILSLLTFIFMIIYFTWFKN
jgi:hypothetical protein